MSFTQATDGGELSQALSLITIPQLAQELGMPTLKLGIQKSPFREDKKGASFSIFKQGYAFKDHARDEHRGNGFNFVQLSRPQWTKKQCAEFIMECAGVSPEASSNGKQKGKRRKQQRKTDPWKERKEKQQVTALPECKEWSPAVRERFLEGWKFLKRTETIKQEIAKERGWPVSVIDSLLENGLISFPLLPWERNRHENRGIAFRVDMPQFATNRENSISMIPIGYHQRFFPRENQKAWLYIPYTPESPFSDFQTQLKTEGNKVAPFPFLLGNPETAQEIVLLEGQWDAVTFSHACGLLETAQESVSVFGLRGSQSVSPLLHGYFSMLINAEKILLFADNDRAGKQWISGLNSLTANLGKRSDAEISVHLLKDGHFGVKDFNDYYSSLSLAKTNRQSQNLHFHRLD